MINLNHPEFEITLKEASKDGTNNEYMTDSEKIVIDFDKVKDKYTQCFRPADTPASNDVLAKKDDQFYFIEFKNGSVNKYNIMKKIYDSLLIFMDIQDKNISFTRENVNFILVYDYEKNKIEINKEIEKRKRQQNKLDKSEILKSSSFNEIIKNIANLANQNNDAFGLRAIFGKIYLKGVKIYQANEFEVEFVRGYSN